VAEHDDTISPDDEFVGLEDLKLEVTGRVVDANWARPG